MHVDEYILTQIRANDFLSLALFPFYGETGLKHCVFISRHRFFGIVFVIIKQMRTFVA